MANDTSLPVRIAVGTFLQEYENDAALDGAEFHVAVPDNIIWPYVRWGVDDAGPFLATGLDGMEIAFTLHVFTEGVTDDDCRRRSARLAKVLDKTVLPLPEADVPATLKDIRWTRTQVLRDIGKDDGWHGIVQFIGLVVS